MLSIKESPDGITFPVRVLPRSSRNEVVGVSDGVLRVKLTAPPVEGAANKALVEFFSRTLKVAKSRITIITGQTGRNKTIHISGMKKEDLSALLG